MARKSQPETTSLELIRAEVASGMGSGKVLSAKIRKAFGVPYCFLSEKQWNEIYENTNLPIIARLEINKALQEYWRGRLSQTVPPNRNKQIKKLKADLDSVVGQLLNLTTDDGFVDGLEGNVKAKARRAKELDHIIDGMLKARSILSNAKQRGPGKPSLGPILELIQDLDHVLKEHAGFRLSRSPNVKPDQMLGWKFTRIDFVQTVLEVAAPNIARATVETYLGKYITSRGPIRDSKASS